MLTAVNLLLRFVGTSFQVYLSSTIGAEGIGLLQLVMSVSGLAMTAGTAGIRTTTMYLSAEELGRKQPGRAAQVLTGCFIYCIITSGTVSVALYCSAPVISQKWIGDMAALPALRTYAAFLPISCLCGVMTGYFTAANRIGTLAAVEVCEQLFTMTVTVCALMLQPHGDTASACRAVVLGNCCGYVLTFTCLLFLYARRKPQPEKIPVARRILSCGVPLALADDLKAGISSLENLMVPIRLALYPGTSSALATFGMVTGMVFPVMMFPAAILYSLAEVLIPELARCAAVGSTRRIRYLIHRNLRVTLLYGLVCGGLLYLLASPICGWLYPGVEVAGYLRSFSVLVPMLYSDLIVDAMTKGLGQQKYCVRYNILSNALDVFLLYFLLPKYGIAGYFASFLVTHLLNFCLSLGRLQKISGVKASFSYTALAVSAGLVAVLGASWFPGVLQRTAGFLALFFCVSYYLGVFGMSDIRWLKNLIFGTKIVRSR